MRKHMTIIIFFLSNNAIICINNLILIFCYPCNFLKRVPVYTFNHYAFEIEIYDKPGLYFKIILKNVNCSFQYLCLKLLMSRDGESKTYERRINAEDNED